ncbi:unnamed protein product [Onchocerca ochengi]|uniref:Uncharacterized protein n=1 Tax=Onchocerca ochengi TaxID=42157 RepID=A0A182EIT0_ONCOC|nr:unnamed protein product [Onchocerca ochengi]
MNNDKMIRSTRASGGPLSSSIPKIKLSPRKSNNRLKNLKNMSYDSDNTEPSSTPSLRLGNYNGNGEQEMTQIPAKKSSASQAIPSFKKKNSSRRSSRSRSRGRHSRRSTPPRSLASQTVKTDSVEKLLPTAVDHSVRNIVKENSTPFENHPLVLIDCL